MFSIVKNKISATAFASENHVQVTLNSISKNNPEMMNFSFKVPPQDTTMKIVYVYRKDGTFEGYVKVEKVYNVPNNKIIDGTYSPVNMSDCRDLIITNYNN